MSNTAPVVNEHSAEAQKATSAAISSTVHEAAARDLREHVVDVLCVIWSKIAVLAAAGVTQLTAMS